MFQEFNMQITQIYAKKYSKLSKKAKGLVLEEYCKETNVSKNLASKRFNKLLSNIYPVALKVTKINNKRGPKVKYTNTHKTIIEMVWKLYGNICAERLHTEFIKGLNILLEERENGISQFKESDISLCKNISLGKLKKIISEFPKPKEYRKRNRKPGIYSKVPIEANFNKYANSPGSVELDPVEHNGGSSAGKYAITACYVCIFSQWTSRVAGLGINLKTIEEIHNKSINKFIHKIIRFHSDNAPALLRVLFDKIYKEKSENVFKSGMSNTNTPEIYSRSRPYKKEDNGHVEQKNGDKIRKLVGYHRYDTEIQVDLLNALYEVEDLITNYFIPSQKLKGKVYNNQGLCVKKIYDKPQTPYKRLMQSKQVDKETKKVLRNTYNKLNLVRLRKESERIKQKLNETVLRKNNSI